MIKLKNMSYININKIYIYNKIILALFFLFFISIQVNSQIKFVAKTQSVVNVGEYFRLIYTVNANGSDFVSPKISDFEILAGPSTSTSTSFQYMYGKSTQSISISFSFVIRGNKIGKFTIPPAKVKVEGKVYESNSVTIEIIKGAGGNNSNANSNNNSNKVNENSNESNKNDIFVKINLNKNSVYQGEHIIATIKLYTRLRLVKFVDMKFPSFTGFWKQDIQTPTNISLQRENINGKIYNSGLLSQTLLFPQKSGEIIIEPYKLEFVAQVKAGKHVDFFGRRVDKYVNVNKKLISDLRKVKVKPLPTNKPIDFSGAVGSGFSINASINKNSVKNNEGITYKIKIKGNGNLKLIDKLKLNFPKIFEVFDPKIVNNIKNTANGQSGSKTFEYLLIARDVGEFIIPSVQFSYFDVNAKKYKTLSTKEFKINIDKGSEASIDNNPNNAVSKEEITLLGNDIRYIKQDDFILYKKDKTFFGSIQFYLSYLILLVIFILILYVARKKINERSNLKLLRTKKADKISKLRLKKANQYLKENNQEMFYKEVSAALWGYLGDKLSIPVSNLSKDNIKSTLIDNKVSTDVIDKFISVLDTCEYAQYAPAENKSEMGNLYTEASSIISKLVQILK